MRLLIIRISRVKTALSLLLLSGFLAAMPTRSHAQCAGTVGTASFDTVVTNTAAGSSTLNGTFNFNVAQFPLSTLTLLSVDIQSSVTASVISTVFNNSPSAGIPSVQLIRSDGISSSVTGNVPGTPNFTSTYTGSSVPPFGTGPVSMPNAVNNSVLISDHITDVTTLSNFTGSDSVGFTYSSNNIPVPLSPFINIGTSVTDQIHFTLTYTYCNPGTLALDLLAFTAVRENDQTVLLNWITASEQRGRKYEVEVSKDGATFTEYAEVLSAGGPGDAAYTYNYPLDPLAAGKLYFRLRLIDEIGGTHFSPIRIVETGSDGSPGGFSIYPNPPTDYINLSLPSSHAWQVEIYTADGSVVQRNSYAPAGQVRVNFVRKLAAGTYFVRATDRTTGENHGGAFVIR